MPIWWSCRSGPAPTTWTRLAPQSTWHKLAAVPFVFAVTQAKMNARVTPQTVALLSAHGTVAPSIIQDRVIYATAMTDGRTAGDLDPKGAAALEILGLWDFVQERLDDRKKGAKEGRKKVA